MKNDSSQKQHAAISAREPAGRLNIISNRILQFLKFFLLPLLCAIFPSLFHYGNNLTILILPSLERMLLFNALQGLAIYVIAYILLRGQLAETANASFIFIIFFNTYGLAYNYLAPLDIIRMEHYTLLPLYILIGVYASWLITKISGTFTTRFTRNAVLILSALVIFNLSKIIPAEIEKADKTTANSSASTSPITAIKNTGKRYPDIYFLIFDEFTGFESMRNYWHYNEVDNFVSFLKSKGFFIAEKSHGATTGTLQLIASRLNYKDYPWGAEYRELYYHDIANSKVMEYLKSLGYTTVVFDETRAFAFPAKTQINSDYNFEYKAVSSGDLGILFDDYGILVSDNTMLLAFSKYYKVISNPVYQQHRGMILYTIKNVADAKISSPKFVYTHLMLPHSPFMFDENGNVTDPEYYINWNSYLENYKYAISVAEKMVTNILSQSDPSNPPIIILQSDHGARIKPQTKVVIAGKTMQIFPEEYKTNIMFALYFPGYDTSTIPQDVNPINTFPIIFNHLFNANIPLQ